MKKKILISISSIILLIGIVITVVLLLPKGEESYRSIKVFDCEGTQEVIRNNKVLEVYEQMSLKNNDEIHVHNDSSMILKLDSDKYIYLEEETKIILMSSEKDSSKTVIRLLEGKIITEVKEKLNDEVFEVETPNSVMAIRGTTFSVEVKKNEKEYEIEYQLIDGKIDLSIYDKINNDTVVNSLSILPEEAVKLIVNFTSFMDYDDITNVKEKVSNGEQKVNEFDSIDEYVNSSDEVKVEKSEYNEDDFDKILDLTESNFRIITICASFTIKEFNVVDEHLYENTSPFTATITADKISNMVVDYWLINDEIYKINNEIVTSESFNLLVDSKIVVVPVYKTNAVECEHDYQTEVINPTCDSEGLRETKCVKCGDISEREVLPIEKHSYESIVTEPTCLEEGYTTYTCSKCNDSYKDSYVESKGHNYGEVMYVWSEDHTSLTATRVCSNDSSHIETETVNSTYSVVTEAKCDTEGLARYTSNSFDNASFEVQTYDITLDKLKHDVISHEGKEATCTESGYKAYETCSRCEYTTYETIEALGHEYDNWEIIKKASCQEEGLATSVCLRCDDKIEEKVEKMDHLFGEWTILSESTCSVAGTRERTCVYCDYKETSDNPLAYHNYGDWRVHKEPTLEEEGIERNYCTECGAYIEYSIDKLSGYTVIVSGGTVNRKGENLNQSSIYVAEGEIVEIAANTYEGYTFLQWNSDGSEIIPTSTFELYVTRNCCFYICFEEGLDYGEWTLEQEKTCTQDGIYSRIDETTGLKQYVISYSRGHEMNYEAQVEKEATCTEGGKCYYECYICGYKECEITSELGHDFNGDCVIVEEAYGSKVGIKEISCTRCDEKTTKEYIKAVYPSGNIKIKYSWNNLSYVSTADREEIHYILGENKYGFEIKRDTENYTFQFYYEDLGKDSPVYVNKKSDNPSYNQYGYDWSIITYVDSYEEFIKYIDTEAKGNDNGRNNSSLYSTFRLWENEFNRVGGIPNGYYCSGITERHGYTCRIMENDGFAYHVNEDNCVLYYSGKGSNRYHAIIESITEITEIPFDLTGIESTSRIPVDIEYGSDGKFKDQSYFQIEKLNQIVEIYEDSYIPDRKICVGYEVKNHDETWVKINELVHNYSHWDSPNNEFTYRTIIETYLDGINPEVLEIRAILEDRELPVHVTVTNGHLESTTNSTQYGTDNYFLANEEVLVAPDYDESKYAVDYIKITTNGEVLEVREDYIYYHRITLPATGEVFVEFVLKDLGSITDEKVEVTINVIGNGSLNNNTGEYSLFSPLFMTANASKGYYFVGWFVQGMYLTAEGDDYPMGNFNEEYYQYGEFFGNKVIYNFNLNDSYDPIVITAIFEEFPTDSIDITINEGFICSYRQTSLHVSSLRIYAPENYDIHGTFEETQNISGWIVTEELEDGPTDTPLDGMYTGYYFTVDSLINPVYITV